MLVFWTCTVNDFSLTEIHTLRSMFLMMLLWNGLHAEKDDALKYSPWSSWSCCYEDDLYRARNCLTSCTDAKLFDRKPCEIHNCGMSQHIGEQNLRSTEAKPNTTVSTKTPPTVTVFENLFYTSDVKRRYNHLDVGTVEFASSSTFGIGMITTLCVSVLVIANFVFTLFFYRAWKKKQKIRRRQSGIERKRTYNILEQSRKSNQHLYNNNMPEKMSRRSTDDIYSNVRESMSLSSSCRSDTYTTIESKDRNTYTDINFSDSFVPPLRKGKRDNLKTLTTLFETHSPEVLRTISKLKTVKVVSEP
ncbi:uncharacterized protein LOC134278307 [Saccostrea cucullata]|uniref:uncharacterized protein LOC134278307 n=1 Tax=Saccostrea cuccullata TaxID=36930 RepID=UPI002ED66097